MCRVEPGDGGGGRTGVVDDQLVDGGRPRGAQLVEAVVAVDHHGPPRAVGRQHPEHLVGHGRVAHPDHLVPGPARVGQRPQVVEDRGDPELPPHRAGEPHGRVEAGGEAEAHPHLVDAPDHPGRAEVGHHAELLQHVGRPHGRGRRPSPVLAHLGPRGRHHQGGDGRHVDAGQPVAAGAAGVDHVEPRRQGQGHGVGHHRPDEPGHLLHRLAFGPEGHHEGGDLRRSGLTREDLPHHRLGLVGGERGASEEPGQHAGPGAQRLERRAGGAGGAVGGGGRIRGAGHQSHHRSPASTPRPIRPSCTCEVPSTMVSCLASRYHCSVGWSSM